MQCGEINEMFSAYIDDMLDQNEKKAVEEHVLECGRCSRELADLQETVRLLRSLGELMPPEGFAGQVRTRLEMEEWAVAEAGKSWKNRLLYLTRGPRKQLAAAVIIIGLGIAMGVYNLGQTGSLSNIAMRSAADSVKSENKAQGGQELKRQVRETGESNSIAGGIEEALPDMESMKLFKEEGAKGVEGYGAGGGGDVSYRTGSPEGVPPGTGSESPTVGTAKIPAEENTGILGGPAGTGAEAPGFTGEPAGEGNKPGLLAADNKAGSDTVTETALPDKQTRVLKSAKSEDPASGAGKTDGAGGTAGSDVLDTTGTTDAPDGGQPGANDSPDTPVTYSVQEPGSQKLAQNTGPGTNGTVRERGSAGPLAETANKNKSAQMVVKDGSMIIEVENYKKFGPQLITLVESFGGYIENSSETAGQLVTASFIIRVPAPNFAGLVEQIESMGKVAEKQISGRDVSAEYIDTQSRMRNLQIQEQRLLGLVDKSQSLDEVLTVEKELVRVREEIEVLQGRLNSLDETVLYSTLRLEVRELPKTRSAREGVLNRTANNFRESASSLSDFLGSLVSGLGWILPWALVLGGSVGAVYFYRKWKAENSNKE